MLKDQKIRDKITGRTSPEDLRRAQFVKAGAGAGKTTSISDRVLNLITKLKTSPEKMVIITYTTKAANELITRIREVLESKENIGNHDVEKALTKLNDAKISTVHSFCYDLLREYPIEFCIDPELTLADEKVTNIMLDNCLEQMEHMDTTNPGQKEFQDFIADNDRKNIKYLKQTLLTLYQNRDLKPIKVDTRSLKDKSHLDEEMRSAATGYFNMASEILEKIKPGCYLDDMYVHITENLADFMKDKYESDFVDFVMDGHRDLIKSKGSQKNFSDTGVLKDIKKHAGNFNKACDYLENLDKVLNYNISLDIYPFFEEVVKQYKELYGFIDFFDGLFLVRNKLKENDHLQELVQERFDVVIIDEFQDSDPMQAEIAFSLAGKDTDKLFFVGDPKQSIYGFSRADISVYMEIMDRVKNLVKGDVLELTTNFRSSGGLVTFINDNFSSILSGLNYKDMDASDEKKDNLFSTENWLIETRLKSDEKKIKVEITRPREAFMVASKIKEMIDDSKQDPEQKLEAGDFLILFRAGTSMEVYEKALKQVGLEVLNTKSKNFLSQSDVIDLLNLLALCAFPSNKFYLAAVEDSDLIFIDREDLDVVLGKNISLELKFRELCRLAGFDSLAVNTNNDTYVQLIENLCSLANSELVANNYNLKKTFLNLYDKALNDSFFSESGISDESIYLQRKNSNAVTLMTIHSAKGLESKVVILAAQDSKDMGKKQLVDCVNKEILIETPFLSKKVADNLDIKELKELYKNAEVMRVEEEKRVLYVAVTRAEERFILLSNYSGTNSSFINTLLELKKKPQFSNKEILKFEDFETLFKGMKQYIPVTVDKHLYDFKKDIFDPLRGSKEGSVAVTELIKEPELFQNVKGRKNGLEFGSFTHLVMENLCTLLFLEKRKDLDCDGLVDRLNDKSDIKLSAGQIGEIKEMVVRFLESELADEIIGCRSLQTEFPFQGDEYHGIIDLIMETDDGVRIIDFKSDLPGENGDLIKAHYGNQIEFYTRAVEMSAGKKVVGECVYLFG